MAARRFTVVVCGRSQVRKAAKRLEATHLLTLLERGKPFFVPPRVPAGNALRLNFDDEDDPAKTEAPTLAHAERILAFGRALPDGARVVVHCEAGLSRSAAAAVALLAQDAGPAGCDAAFHEVLAQRPGATPNTLLLRHVDQLLNTGGRLEALALARRSEPGLRF